MMNPLFSLPQIHSGMTDFGLMQRKASIAKLLLNPQLNACLTDDDWSSIGRTRFDGVVAAELETKIITEFENRFTFKRGAINTKKITAKIKKSIEAENPILKLLAAIAAESSVVDENLLIEMAKHGLSPAYGDKIAGEFNSILSAKGSLPVANLVDRTSVTVGIYPTAISLGKLVAKFSYHERQMLHQFLAITEHVYNLFSMAGNNIWFFEQLVDDLKEAYKRFGHKRDKEKLIEFLCEDPDSNEDSFMGDEDSIRDSVELATELMILENSPEYRLPKTYFRDIKASASKLLKSIEGMRIESALSKEVCDLLKTFLQNNIESFTESHWLSEEMRIVDEDNEFRFSSGLIVDLGERLGENVAEYVYENCMQMGEECIETLAYERSDDRLKALAKRLIDFNKITTLLNNLSDISKRAYVWNQERC